MSSQPPTDSCPGASYRTYFEDGSYHEVDSNGSYLVYNQDGTLWDPPDSILFDILLSESECQTLTGGFDAELNPTMQGSCGAEAHAYHDRDTLMNTQAPSDYSHDPGQTSTSTHSAGQRSSLRPLAPALTVDATSDARTPLPAPAETSNQDNRDIDQVGISQKASGRADEPGLTLNQRKKRRERIRKAAHKLRSQLPTELLVPERPPSIRLGPLLPAELEERTSIENAKLSADAIAQQYLDFELCVEDRLRRTGSAKHYSGRVPVHQRRLQYCDTTQPHSCNPSAFEPSGDMQPSYKQSEEAAEASQSQEVASESECDYCYARYLMRKRLARIAARRRKAEGKPPVRSWPHAWTDADYKNQSQILETALAAGADRKKVLEQGTVYMEFQDRIAAVHQNLFGE